LRYSNEKFAPETVGMAKRSVNFWYPRYPQTATIATQSAMVTESIRLSSRTFSQREIMKSGILTPRALILLRIRWKS